VYTNQAIDKLESMNVAQDVVENYSDSSDLGSLLDDDDF